MNGLSAPSSSPARRVFLGWGTEVESVGVVLVGEGLGLLAPIFTFKFVFSSIFHLCPGLCEFGICAGLILLTFSGSTWWPTLSGLMRDGCSG